MRIEDRSKAPRSAVSACLSALDRTVHKGRLRRLRMPSALDRTIHKGRKGPMRTAESEHIRLKTFSWGGKALKNLRYIVSENQKGANHGRKDRIVEPYP